MSINIHQDKILILDFGSQYTQLIARRVRELGVYCELYPYDIDESVFERMQPKGIILSGGPESVVKSSEIRAPEWVFTSGLPVLGICYGMQTMAMQLGGNVSHSDSKEFGHAPLTINTSQGIFASCKKTLDVWMSHGDKVTAIPEGFSVLAQSPNAPIAAMGDMTRHYYGVQFHPEVTHTEMGKEILSAFVHEVCDCGDAWTADNIIEDAVRQVKETVGDDEVLLALSGGVDSSVVAALLHRAIGDKLTCVFVDTGLLRYREVEEVQKLFAEERHIRLITVDAKDKFYGALNGVSDPEAKRKACGRVFIEVFQEQAKNLQGIKWLAQGTIYPDVIESAAASSGKAHAIKSHHNVGGLPEDMHLKLVEPLRELFKDEVRKIGLALGLPKNLIFRHPFPGPGLTVRILGAVSEEKVAVLQQADHIFISALREAGLYDRVSQAFAVYLPVKSVGVVGDARCYEDVIALRAVETIDFMTAHWAELPHAFLGEVARRICNEVTGVSRVVYDITGKPPGTIEWE